MNSRVSGEGHREFRRLLQSRRYHIALGNVTPADVLLAERKNTGTEEGVQNSGQLVAAGTTIKV